MLARINSGYSLTRHNAFSWLAPRFNVTQMSLRTDSNLLFAPYDITRNKKRPLPQHCEPHFRSSNLNFLSPTIGVRFIQAEGLFCLSVFSLFTLFFRENVGKMWAKIGCREWCGYGVSGFLRLDIVTRLGYNGGVGKERR